MIGTKLRCITLILSLSFLLAACGGDESSDNFQTNHRPPFELAKITEGYGAVDEAWESIDTKGFNTRLAGPLMQNLKNMKLLPTAWQTS